MYICIYIYTYAYIYLYIHTYKHIYIYTARRSHGPALWRPRLFPPPVDQHGKADGRLYACSRQTQPLLVAGKHPVGKLPVKECIPVFACVWICMDVY